MDERDEVTSGLGDGASTPGASPQGDGDQGTQEPGTDAPAEQKAEASE